MPKPRKILYIITKSVWGGAQRYVFDLATHIPREQFDIAVACGGRGPLAEKLEKAGIRTIGVPQLDRDISFGRELSVLRELIRLLRVERPDIIHLSSSKAGGLGAVAARLASMMTGRRATIVFSVHGWPFGEDRPRWQRASAFFFSWLSTLFQNRVIVIDTADRRAARWFVPEDKLTLVFHGIAPIDFLPREAARAFFMKATGRPIGAKVILIGVNAELTKNKGLSHLIDAINLMKFHPAVSGTNSKFQTIVVGEGEERQRLQEKIQTLGLGGRIFPIGFLPDAKRYLKALDIFVLPSVKEGLPYAIMEAMAAGLPIVASRVGGIPDLIEDGLSGVLVPPRDPQALALSLASLISNPGRRQTLGHAARQRIGTFSMGAMMDGTLRAYGKVRP